MNINYRQPQFELFPADSALLDDTNKPRFLLANLTLSIESLVIFTILGIMVGLFAYSLGVERGKHLAAQALDERVQTAWNAGTRTMAAAAVITQPLRHRPLALPAFVADLKHFTLQAATYGNEAYAKQDALQLKSKGCPSLLIKNGKYWLLCIGNFQAKDNAAAFLRKLPGPYRFSQVRRF